MTSCLRPKWKNMTVNFARNSGRNTYLITIIKPEPSTSRFEKNYHYLFSLIWIINFFCEVNVGYISEISV